MVSTTSNKKEIIDFLWEWAESHGDWGKILIDKIVRTESNISKNERQTIFNYFLQSIGLYIGLPKLSISKPTYLPTSRKIEITSLLNITGVNKLAKNQIINFCKNITVIYGENATGKTGYSRILKFLGYSYDENNLIHPNIYGSVEPKSATINFKTNNKDEPPFIWNGKNRNSELENLSVFNSSCVQFSLSDRQLIVSPIGFHLFNLVSAELNELENLLQAKIASYSIILPWKEKLTEGTPQQIIINGLTDTSTIENLNKLSSFTPKQQQVLNKKELELSNLNKMLLQNEINNLISQEKELEDLILKIQTAQSLLTSSNWQKLISLNKQIIELKKETNKGLKEIAESNGIEYYETKEFQEFIQSAEDYIRILTKKEYPLKDDLCIYCKQPLEISAVELLKSYRILLNDKTQENIQQLNHQKKSLIDQITQIDTKLYLHQPSFGVDKNQKAIQPNEIKKYNQNLRLLKNTFCTDNIDQDSTFAFDYEKTIKYLSDKKIKITHNKLEKKDLLSNLSKKETGLKLQIAELKDRKLLSIKRTEIENAISNHKFIALLKSNSTSFNTGSISHKTSQARDFLIKQNFNQTFQEELKALRKSNIKIDLNFATEKGKSRVSQKIEKHLLTDILSEGEQKAIALAEFLTELQLDNINAPVIFDDPVNSLDHHIIDEVVKRLIILSRTRQVIVFTHSVLFFNSMLYLSKQPLNKDLSYKFYNSRNEFDETGVISEAEEEINKVSVYISKINTLINNTPKGKPESELAEDGYGYLRSAIELLVEHEIFQGTVKRYQKNVALTSFVKVNGSLLDVHKGKLNEIFERSCGYIKGHSNPSEIHNDPTLKELNDDFEDFKKIRDSFNKQ